MKKSLALVLHLDDHKHDNLGGIFLDAVDENEARRRLRRYLGGRVVIKQAERQGTHLRVAVELTDFEAESDNLVRLARRLDGRKRPHAAQDQLEEALHLFPLNANALKSLGRHHLAREDYAAAAGCYVRANEVLHGDGETLRALADIALHDGRDPSAIQYYQRALQADPRDTSAAESLAALQERIAARFGTPGSSGSVT